MKSYLADELLPNVQAYLKWLGMGCVKCEDASGVGVYSPGVSARSME